MCCQEQRDTIKELLYHPPKLLIETLWGERRVLEMNGSGSNWQRVSSVFTFCYFKDAINYNRWRNLWRDETCCTCSLIPPILVSLLPLLSTLLRRCEGVYSGLPISIQPKKRSSAPLFQQVKAWDLNWLGRNVRSAITGRRLGPTSSHALFHVVL